MFLGTSLDGLVAAGHRALDLQGREVRREAGREGGREGEGHDLRPVRVGRASCSRGD